MPDIWTHLIAGDRISQAISRPEWASIINDLRPIFDFGCQGPDFFLYYSFWPWASDMRGAVLGDAIHDRHCGSFFDQVFAHVVSLDGTSHYHATAAYGLGLLCHWALDRTTHPYIHYIAGLYTRDDPSVAHLNGNHKRIEAIIDTILAKEYWGIATDQVPANQRFAIGRELPAFIADLYHRVLPAVYPDLWRHQAQDCVAKSYRDMMTACRVLFDPSGAKKKAVAWLENLLGDGQHLTRFFYPRQVSLSVDYLNDRHLPWCHPADRDEISYASFRDLMDQAITDGRAIVNSTIDYLVGELDHASWRQAIGNLSFSTGKDCDLPFTLRFTQPILE